MRLLKNLTLLTALFLMSSCSSTGVFQKRHTDSMFCPSSAIVDVEFYKIEGPADNSRASVDVWINDLATKYPDLLMRYDQLQECWLYYSSR